jgi:RNA polymerase primary sigma factor
MMKTPPLTADEERELALRVAAGDVDARREMIERNVGLVWDIGRRYFDRGLASEDIVGDGTLGLIVAVDRFRLSFGVRFSTYAGHWIKKEIMEALIERGTLIRLPRSTVKLLGKWRRAERAIYCETGRTAAFSEVADRLGLDHEKRAIVRMALKSRDREPAPAAGAAYQHDLGSPVDDADEREMLRRRLDRLDERERSVITMRYGLDGEPALMREIGKRLGVTRQWAHRLEYKALGELLDAVVA